MDLYIEILAGDSKRGVFNWIHSDDCETEMSSGKRLQIHTHVALSCDLFEIVFLPVLWLLCQTVSLFVLIRVKSSFFLQNGQIKIVTLNNLPFAVKFPKRKRYFIENLFNIYTSCALGLPVNVCSCCLPSIGPALTIAHTGTTLNLLLCNNTHIHSPQTANCFSHSPPRPAFVLSHLQNKLCWKFHYKLPCVCQIPPGAEEIKTLDLPAPTETDFSLTHTEIMEVGYLFLIQIIMFSFI